MASITSAAHRVKDDLSSQLSEALVRQACEAAGHPRKKWRDRLLPPWVVLRLFALQILSGNVACGAVTRLSELTFTAQAYCKARAMLPVDVLGYIAAALTHEARTKAAACGDDTSGGGRWKGHRVMHIDGPRGRDCRCPTNRRCRRRSASRA